MSAQVQSTCSECGVVLTKGSESALARCEPCQKRGAGKPSHPTAPFPDSGPTRILKRFDDTDPGGSHHANTVDFMPSADPTEPTAHATDDRVAQHQEIGRFKVRSILGRGTFGTVYLAHDPLLDREVAVKVPRFAADDREMTSRFHREAKSAARLHHPNIVALHESGQCDTGPYLVSEYIDGQPLSQVIRERNWEIRTVVDWVRQIAEGLNYAHSEGIIHRDVKPANIMIDSAGRPRIMDFGLAKRSADLDPDMTVEGQIVGTPNYMSPEQARGAIAEVGPHSDQYSVGVILYELLCGHQPFEGDAWSIIARVANVKDLPQPPRVLEPDLPRDLEACCLKAIEKQPDARYPTLLAFADDLDHWLKGLPLLARPIGPIEQLLRWCRQNRTIAAMGLAIFVITLVAAVGGYWLAAIAQREAREATNARLATEQVNIDTFTETGLTADRNGDPREAILWFSNAVAAAEHQPLREAHNRIRVQSWLSEIAIPLQAFEQPAGWNESLKFHPSGKYLLALGMNGEAELLRLSDGKRLPFPNGILFRSVIFSPDGKQLAFASESEVWLRPFDADRLTDSVSAAIGPESDRWTHSEAVNVLEFSRDGQLLLVGGEQTAQVRDVTAKSTRTIPLDVESLVTAGAFSGDGQRFAVRCKDQKVRVFACDPAATSEPLLPPLPSASPGTLTPKFLGNDRLLVCDDYQTIRCWDLAHKSMVWEQAIKRVLSFTVSPDGRWIALGEDFQLRLLDAQTGDPVNEPAKHSNLINAIQFDPSSSLVATASEDHFARIFAAPSLQPQGPPMPHNRAVHRLDWSPDGKTLATVHWGGEVVRVWKRNEVRPSEFLATKSADAPFVRFNERRDRWLPSGFDNGRVRTELEVIDIATGQAVGPKLSATGLISDADFVPQSPFVVLAGGGAHADVYLPLDQQKLDQPGYVRLVNAETGAAAFADVVTPCQAIAVRSSPDGRTVVALCHEGELVLIDATTGQKRAEHVAFGGGKGIYGYVIRERIRFSPNGEMFAIWGNSVAVAELRETRTGDLRATLSHASGFIHDVVFSPDGQMVATCSSDAENSVRLWNTETGESRGQPMTHADWVFSAQFSANGQRLLTASADRQARIWDVATNTSLVATREHSDQVFGVTFFANDEQFLVCTRDGTLTAWDATLGKMLAPTRQLSRKVYQLSLGGTGTTVLASGDLRPIRAFDVRRWILPADTRLSREDIKLLGEILSSQRVHEAGAATRLTTSEWLSRWKLFRQRHPEASLFHAPAPATTN